MDEANVYAERGYGGKMAVRLVECGMAVRRVGYPRTEVMGRNGTRWVKLMGLDSRAGRIPRRPDVLFVFPN